MIKISVLGNIYFKEYKQAKQVYSTWMPEE